MSHIVIVVNSLSFFISHRLDIAIEAVQLGKKVTVLSNHDSDKQVMLKKNGIDFKEVAFDRKSINPFKEILTFCKLTCFLKSIEPTVVHLVTIKPVIYGGLYAMLSGLPVLYAISGLGSVFSSKKNFFIRFFVELVYKVLFSRNLSFVIVQNERDYKVISNLAGGRLENIELIPGSGIDVQSIKYVGEPCAKDTVVISFAARLLKEKGIQELVDAVIALNARGVKCKLMIAGIIDSGNSNSISQEQLDYWTKFESIEVLGFCEDVLELYRNSHIVSLPSYYGEGVPKSLIEAAAVGRPIVTTDMPGCNLAVVNNKTGLLVKPQDSYDLALKLEVLIQNQNLRNTFGVNARQYAQDTFQLRSVIKKHLRIYNKLEKLGLL